MLLSGCDATVLNEEEHSALEHTFDAVVEIKNEFRELEKIYEKTERGRNFISYSYNMSGGSTPLMNPGYFWFKLSLSDRAVEPMDLQRPLLQAYVPKFNKFFKLRVNSANRQLMAALMEIFISEAEDLGATDIRRGESVRSMRYGIRQRALFPNP